MKNILSKIKNNYLLIYVITNLIYILVGSILRTHKIIEYSTFSYGYIVLLGINILIILILFFKPNLKIDILINIVTIINGM